MTPEDRAVEAVRTVRRHKDLDPDAVRPDSALADLDLDSLDLAEALLILEDDLGVELDESAGLRRVSDLAALVATAAAR